MDELLKEAESCLADLKAGMCFQTSEWFVDFLSGPFFFFPVEMLFKLLFQDCVWWPPGILNVLSYKYLLGLNTCACACKHAL